MAFDRPIEADRIDDFNLFSAFVRAPLWILGGVLGSNNEDEDEIMSGGSISPNSSPNTSNSLHIGGSDSGSPARVVSDDALPPSSITNQNNPFNNIHNNPTNDGDMEQLHERFGECSVEWHSSATDDGSLPSKGLKRSKNLSWSDESGQRLVEFNDEVSNALCVFSVFYSCEVSLFYFR